VCSSDLFDAVITDMQMPDTDGITLGRRIKDDPRFQSVKLILLTSVGQRGDAKQAAEEGFAAYLTKPIKNNQLLRCIRTVLGNSAETHVPPTLVTRHSLAETKLHGHILVVEDNAVNQVVARRMLEKLGHTTEIVSNGREALDRLAQSRFDLVLMDCQMPVMDGYEATTQLRQGLHGVLDPNVPVIALTANVMQGDREKSVAAGMNDHLAKPYSATQLQGMIERWLNAVSAPEIWKEETYMAPSEPVNEPVFDVTIILNNFEQDLDIVREILPEGVEDLVKNCQALGESLASAELDNAARVAHTLKGLGLSFGSKQAHSLSEEIEAMIKDHDINAAKALLPKLVDTVERLRQEADAWLNQSKQA
jgi:CheY-like chemotaxis protein